MKPSISTGTPSAAPPRKTPQRPAMSKPPNLARTSSGSAGSGALTAMPVSMAAILRARPASERPAPRPVMRETGCPSSTAATALEVVVLPMPISPVASRRLPFAFWARTSATPLPMASTASARDMAGPQVKSCVPSAMRQSSTPGTWGPAMPRSTGTTWQWAVRAIWQTLVRRAARFWATARVTLLSVWLTPWATTPLSAQRTRTARLLKSNAALPVRAAASSSIVSSAPRPPRGLARLAQWAWAAARAASSRGVMAPQRVLSSVSVILFPRDIAGRPPQSAEAGACRPNTNAGSPHRNARLQSRSPRFSRWILRR